MDNKFLNIFYFPFVYFFSYLGLDQEQIAIYSVLIFLDFVTGLIKGFTRCSVRFRVFYIGLASKLLFLLIPFVFALAAKALHYEVAAFLGVVLSIMILSETFSIVRNIYIIKTGKQVENFDVLGMLIELIRKRLSEILK